MIIHVLYLVRFEWHTLWQHKKTVASFGSIISASLSISIVSGVLMLLNIHVAHLSVRTCELWQNGWLDPDAIWIGEWGRARYGCIGFWWWSSKGEGLFLAWFLTFIGICTRIRFNGWNDVFIADRLVCEKLTKFPYAEYTVEICVELAFSWYSQVQDRSGGWWEMYTNVTVNIRMMAILPSQ